MLNALYWFRLLVVVGGIANLTFALPAFFFPGLIGMLIDTGDIAPNIWLRNVGILLIILSVLYIPAVLDPFRYIFNSVVLIVGRFSAGLFFLIMATSAGYPDGFRVLAMTDIGLSIVQAIVFFFLLRAGDPRFGQPGGYLSETPKP